MKRPPIPTEASFTSPLRNERLSARIGTWLGVSFGLCFLTGLISHWYYLPDLPVLPPVRPLWGYRVTQGVHVLSGTAAIPLLLVKLWSVYPKLFGEIPFGKLRPLLINLAEKASIAVLVAAAIFQLVTGLANSSGWYPWSFSFRSTHYAVAWIAIGALVVHIAVKLPIIRAAYAEPLPEPPATEEPARRGPAAAPSCAPLCSRRLLRSSRQPGTRCRSCARSRSSRCGPEKVPRESRSTGPRRQPAYSPRPWTRRSS